jgi:hypothetical protein
MKTTLAAIIISSCLVGIGAAERKDNDRNTNKAPAKREARVHKGHANETEKAKANAAKEIAKEKRALEEAARKKALETKKAAEAAAKKQAEYAKRGEELASLTKDLVKKRLDAYAERQKKAEALRASEQKVAAIDAQIKKVQLEQKLRIDTLRRKAEAAAAQRARAAVAKEKADMVRMCSDIDTVKRDISQLLLQVEKLPKQEAPPKAAKE